jgi:hypothetical protein
MQVITATNASPESFLTKVPLTALSMKPYGIKSLLVSLLMVVLVPVGNANAVTFSCSLNASAVHTLVKAANDL